MTTAPPPAAPLPDLSALSLNQITINRWSLPEALEGCRRHGIGWIGVWRDKVAECGLDRAAALVRDSGLRVSSLCRGGFFPAATPEQRRARRDDNRRAVDEAVALGTDLLVLVCGPPADGDLEAARRQVVEGIEELAPYAASAGVRLGIEPLHPMFAADRSVVVTLAQANQIALRFPADQVGVVIDAYHVWWDPEVYAEIERAAGRILGFHVSDWIVPPPDHLLGRGLMGDGVIAFRRLRAAVEAAGYRGPIEVEILNQALWDLPPDEALAAVRARFLAHV
ncbi:MAG TPA: sugar phosphate isomerase/epimerase family protein [Acidimicrobiales bacterium]|nr:sugar phosphate isomerase/epimerase family protein [Acidimicrobiales bacterium]